MNHSFDRDKSFGIKADLQEYFGGVNADEFLGYP